MEDAKIEINNIVECQNFKVQLAVSPRYISLLSPYWSFPYL